MAHHDGESYDVILIADIEDFNNVQFANNDILYKLGTSKAVNKIMNSTGKFIDFDKKYIPMCNRDKYYGNYKATQITEGEVNTIVEMIGVVNIRRFENVFYKLGNASDIKSLMQHNKHDEMSTPSNKFGKFPDKNDKFYRLINPSVDTPIQNAEIDSIDDTQSKKTIPGTILNNPLIKTIPGTILNNPLIKTIPDYNQQQRGSGCKSKTRKRKLKTKLKTRKRKLKTKSKRSR